MRRSLLKIFLYTLLAFLGLTPVSFACSPADTSRLRDVNSDYDARGELAACLVRNFYQNNDVMAQVLKNLRDPNEHVFVREDIAEALADLPLRKSVEVREALAKKEISNQEKEAMDRTLASAKEIMNVAQAVKSMKDEVVTTKYESEIVRTLSEIAMNTENHIELRQTAVKSLSQITKKELDSGMYEEKNLRVAYEALKSCSENNDKDNAAYYSGADRALASLMDSSKGQLFAGIVEPNHGPSRNISSVGPMQGN